MAFRTPLISPLDLHLPLAFVDGQQVDEQFSLQMLIAVGAELLCKRIQTANVFNVC